MEMKELRPEQHSKKLHVDELVLSARAITVDDHRTVGNRRNPVDRSQRVEPGQEVNTTQNDWEEKMTEPGREVDTISDELKKETTEPDQEVDIIENCVKGSITK